MTSVIVKEFIKFLKKKFSDKEKNKNKGAEEKANTSTPAAPAAPTAPVAPTPPPGWTAHHDANANRYYYVETATGRTTWDAPEGTILPPPAPPAALAAPAEAKKEDKKPDYLKMATSFHKKSKGGKSKGATSGHGEERGEHEGNREEGNHEEEADEDEGSDES